MSAPISPFRLREDFKPPRITSMSNQPVLLTLQRRYTSSAIEDILLGQSKYILDYDLIYFTEYLFVYYFTSHILYRLPKMLYRIGLLFLIQFTSTKIRTFFSNANKS